MFFLFFIWQGWSVVKMACLYFKVDCRSHRLSLATCSCDLCGVFVLLEELVQNSIIYRGIFATFTVTLEKLLLLVVSAARPCPGS